MLKAQNISKKFVIDGQDLTVLRNVTATIDEGEFVAVTGRSGSGKTTLLNVLSTLVRPSEGELHYLQDELTNLSEKRLNYLRNRDFSVIFQFHHLLPYLTALENTLLPFMQSIRPISQQIVDKARDCLCRVGLEKKIDRLPGKLSGGEQQRVAIARALVKSSRILFADEPTGSLDKNTGEQIMALLQNLNEEGLTVVLVTHDPEYATLAKRSIHLEDGRVIH